MNEPKHPTSKEAIRRFNERFAYAKEHYFAEQFLLKIGEKYLNG